MAISPGEPKTVMCPKHFKMAAIVRCRVVEPGIQGWFKKCVRLTLSCCRFHEYDLTPRIHGGG